MFEEKIVALNQKITESASHFDKRTYTVDEIQKILNVSKVQFTRDYTG